MNKKVLLSIVFGSSIFCSPIFSQNYQTSASLGLPGDNLNLYGVLNIFQESKTLEEFEQKLNTEDSKLNNLDLNGDGKTDYIKIIDNVNGNAHTIVLQDAINETESQDIAVIEVERDKNDQIQIQIIGDEQLYGKDYIIEPVNGTPNPGYNGKSNQNGTANENHTIVNNNYYNTNNKHGNGSDFVYAVGAWSIIHFIFDPTYAVYVSPWRWSYYPTYWHPYHQMHYNDYYGHWHNHHSNFYFRKTHSYRVPTAHGYYGPRKTSSVIVRQRIEKGEYNKTNVNIKPTNNVQVPNNNRRSNNEQYKGENRKPSASENSTPKRVTPTNNYNKPNPSERPNKRPIVKPNEAPIAKPNERPIAKPNERPIAKPNINPAKKQEERRDSKTNK